MADSHAQGHDYHLVDPSYWPLVGATSAFILAGGLIWFMHDGPPWILLIGMAGVLYTMFGWWRDVIKEATFEGHHTSTVQLGMRYGMALFIASEVMFFVAWFWAYFNAALYPTTQMGGVFPPEGIDTFDPWHLPLMNTLILLTSGTTVTWAHHAVVRGNQRAATQGLLATVLLGALFTLVQAIEYANAPFIHICMMCMNPNKKGHFKPDHHFGLVAAAWYWHFVDVVWLFLFCGIYVWGAGPLVPG